MANANAEVDSVYKSLRLLPEFDDYVQESIEYTETSHDEASKNNATYAENEEDFRVNSRSDKPK
ncbi:hypothetical protein JYU34_010037 [Plutella xylostella]|uniref:Uncharacterized protein n=1 Tax=Plutella xylostella TaxID=51655 RepID=A0ABQ7QHI8_PLUXY|nr:hypothetical protein JYU34_010037 [Plutella xylostella]